MPQTSLMPSPKQQFFNNSGQVLAGGMVYTAQPGTFAGPGQTSPKATYTDSTGSVPNANPVVLDAAGRGSIWLSGFYKVAVYDASGNLIYTQDNVSSVNNNAALPQLPWIDAAANGGLNATVNAIGSAVATLYITTPQTLSASLVIPANISVMIQQPGVVALGVYNLTINGPFSAGVYQVFAGTGAVTGLKEARPEWFGAFPDGINHTAAMTAVAALAQAGTQINFSSGTYLTGTPWRFTSPVKLIGTPGARIKLTAGPNPYVIQLDGTGASPLYMIGPVIRDIIFDGGGTTTDGLYLKGVVAGVFTNIRATNITGAGLHLAWAQSCDITNFICSRQAENTTVLPANGILSNGQMSSNNTITNPIIEFLSGTGIKLLSSINTVIINGTSEGNNIGIELGEAVLSQGTGSGYNTIIGMDIENNTVADIISRSNSVYLNLLGVRAFSDVPGGAVQFFSSNYNLINGGTMAGIAFDGFSSYNNVNSTNIIGATQSITIVYTDNLNTWSGVRNISTGAILPDVSFRRLSSFAAPNGSIITIDAAKTSYSMIVATGTAFAISAPLNPADGQELDITILNQGGAVLAVTWATGAGGFKSVLGWVNPAYLKSRSARFRYSAVPNSWYPVSFSQMDEDS